MDVWACGVTLYNLVSGEYPFDADVIMRLYENITNQPLEMPKTIQLDNPLQALLTAMLEKDPETRVTTQGIRTFAWFRRKLAAGSGGKRVPVPEMKNAPAHRPLTVYRALIEMYGGEDEETADEPIDAPCGCPRKRGGRR